MSTEVRDLEEADRDEAWQLGRLAFGGDPAAPRPPHRPGRRSTGLFEDGRLVAAAAVLEHAQWWGGRAVPMGGVASVAVHPDARGRGAGSRLVRALLAQMAEQGQVVSALFPTAVGFYRRLGWEVVGSLDETRLPPHLLRGARPADGVRVRTAGLEDAAVLQELWAAQAAASAGALTRTGPCFLGSAQEVLEADLVALAEVDGRPEGYVAYDRGRGYRAGSTLHVHELVARSRGAALALAAHLAGWEAVVEAVRWSGPLDDLARLLDRSPPPPVQVQPWMLRVVDPAAAVAARGYPPGARLDAVLVLADPDVPASARPWRLVVDDGAGQLEPADDRGGVARLSATGLALLYAGIADDDLLVRGGLLDRPVPGLAAAFAGPRPVLLDYF